MSYGYNGNFGTGNQPKSGFRVGTKSFSDRYKIDPRKLYPGGSLGIGKAFWAPTNDPPGTTRNPAPSSGRRWSSYASGSWNSKL